MQINLAKRKPGVWLISLIVVGSVIYWATKVPVDTDKWFAAIVKGDIKSVKSQLKSGVPASLSRNNGQSSLRIAVANNNYHLVDILLSNGANINEKIISKPSLLHVAIANDNIFIVERLLLAGIDSNVKDRYENNMFDIALRHGQFDILAELLIYNKKFLNRVNTQILPKYRKIFALTTISKKNPKLSKKLNIAGWLYVKARLYENDKKTEIAIKHYLAAANRGYFPSNIKINYLVSYHSSKIISHDLVTEKIDSICSDYKKIKYFKNIGLSGLKPYMSNLYGRCLLKAERKRYPTKAAKLIRYAADKGNILAQGYLGKNIGILSPDLSRTNEILVDLKLQKHYLKLAAKQGHAYAAVRLARLYLEQNDISNALIYFNRAGELGNAYVYGEVAYKFREGSGVKKDYKKAIIWYQKGADQGDKEAAETLAKAYLKGEMGLKKDSIKAAEYDTNTVIVSSVLIKVISDNDKVRITQLIRLSKKKTDLKKSLWLYAAMLGNQSLLEELHRSGIDVNLVYKGSTALIRASGSKHIEIVKWLIEKGANVNLVGQYASPLLMASSLKRINSIKFLLSRGANVNLAVQGKTALMRAIDVNSISVIKLLLSRGADINAKDNLGHSVYRYASRNNTDNIQRLVLTHPKLQLAPDIKTKELGKLNSRLSKKQRLESWAGGRLIVRLNSRGQPLSRQNRQYNQKAWACIRDKITKLEWVVKTDDSSMHDKDNYYWHPSAKKQCTANSCDTNHYLKNINNKKVCGFNDWRFPTTKELETLTFPVYQTVFPYWPGFAIWGSSEKNSEERVIIWANGLFGRYTGVIQTSLTAKTILVRGKISPLPFKTNADFTIIRFKP